MRILRFAGLLIFTAFILNSSSVYAEKSLSTIGAGFAGFINDYDPAWGSEYDTLKSGTGVENGMFLIAGKGRWLWSFLVMSTIFGSNGNIDFSCDEGLYTKTVDSSMERSDFDLILQYSATSRIKIFGGLKLFNILLDTPDMTVNGTPLEIESSDEDPCEFNGYGFGLGLSYQQPIVNSDTFRLAVQPQLSYIRVSGSATQSFVFVTNYNTAMTAMDDYEKAKYTAQGVNGVINLIATYIISESSNGGGSYFTLSVGYRYQYLRYKASESYIELGDEKHSGLMIMAMVTATYEPKTGCCIL